MRLDFWNNPLVVTAFRLRYRRGAPTTWTCIYLLVLLIVGAMLFRYQERFPAVPWTRVYLLVILGAQFILSGLISAFSTFGSLRAEVVNQTLDFQRIAAVSPREILLGKLLGEPAMSYLLAIASIPLAVLCCLLGACSFDVLALIYVHLATTSLMLGTIGLAQPLQPPPEKSSASRQNQGSAGAAIGLLAMFTAPGLIFNMAAVSGNPWGSLPVGALTPILALYGVATGQPWEAALPIGGLKIPYLFIAPVVQLVVAGVFFEIMARKLKNPLDPPLSKPRVYGLALLVDVIAAGLLYETSPLALSMVGRTAVFCLLHLVVSLVLASTVTPRREGFGSWVWRFRGRMPWWRDTWLGDRSENTGVLLTLALLGAAALGLLVWLPAWGVGVAGADMRMIRGGGVVLGVSALLLLALGLVAQWGVILAGRHGMTLFVFLLLLLILAPLLVGVYFDEIQQELIGVRNEAAARLAYGFSPAVHYAYWIGKPDASLSLLPLLFTYGTLLLVGWWGVRRAVAGHAAMVEAKLLAMGVERPLQ